MRELGRLLVADNLAVAAAKEQITGAIPPGRTDVTLVREFALITGLAFLLGCAACGRPPAVAAAAAPAATQMTMGGDIPPDAPAGQNTLKDVLAIAVPVVQARIATAEEHHDYAASLLRQAVAAEDNLAYDEPKNWFFPARHLLGAQLLHAGKPAEAEVVYREDLRQSPANGWALYGLGAALKAQGKTQEAERVAQQFKVAWQNADIRLTASAY